jgi:hypothetical protein
MERSKFIEVLTDLTFWIYFHDEKYPKGKIFWNNKTRTWGFDESKDYWNFDIQFNSLRNGFVIDNWYKNDYKEFLEYWLTDFIKQNDVSYLSSISQSECFDLLNQEVVKLNQIYKHFYTKIFIDEDNSDESYELLWHYNLDLKIANDDEIEKLYKEKGDRFFNEQISSYLFRKKDVIEQVINLLNIKIQWSNRELAIKTSRPKVNKDQSLKFVDNKLLDSLRLDAFRKSLVDSGLIDKMDARLFAKCFSGKKVDEKINWKNSEVSIIYFLKQLVKKGFIEDKSKWVALSNSFLRKSKPIDSELIKHTSTKCKNKEIILNIDACILQLVKKTSSSIEA